MKKARRIATRLLMPFLVIPLVFSVFFIVFPSGANASALEQFRNFLTHTKTAKGEFTQVQVKMEDKAKISNSASGIFSFSRPGKFIWEYKKPYEQLLQADGETLYIYDKDLNQVTIKKLGDALGSSPAAILFGSNQMEKNFRLKEMGARDGIEWLEAKPKAKDTPFERINIGMRQGVLTTVELYDTFGQVSLIHFTKMENNPALKPGYFKFTVPKGADVFKN